MLAPKRYGWRYLRANPWKNSRLFGIMVELPGEVTEWFKVTVLKTVVGQLTASSNLALSAIEKRGLAPLFSMAE